MIVFYIVLHVSIWLYKVVPPSYKLIDNPSNYRYNYHKSYLLEL